jgi:hypothetical protein
MKLYGKELDEELDRRKKIKEENREKKLTLRQAAKTNDMGLTVSEYCAWIYGYDICPHEEREKTLGCIHPPFLILNRCTKCGHIEIIGKEEDVSKEVSEEAFQNTKRKMKSSKRIIDGIMDL